MDHRRFDSLARAVAGPRSRRGFLGGLAALGAGLMAGRDAGAQPVTQATCGNKTCKNNPARCTDGCVCCTYSNGNSRCRPPGQCAPGTVLCPPGQVVGQSGVCVAPATTTPTPLPPFCDEVTPCGVEGTECLGNNSCAAICQESGGCADGCGCSPSSTEGVSRCVISNGCDGALDRCSASSECPPGYHCQFTTCNNQAFDRCVNLCQVA